MVLDDPIMGRVLIYLADRYRPVTSDWVDMSEIARALGLSTDDVVARCQRLLEQAFVETAPADAENESPAALITVKGLLAVGRVP
jgi:DNA-binding MarR family transcriptional regulator